MEDMGYVKVFETSDPDLIPVVKSLLESYEIPFQVEGEGIMNIFPSEMLGALFKPAAEVRFLVPADRAEEAREILEATPEEPEHSADAPDTSSLGDDIT